MKKKRYVQVGTGNRARFFYERLLKHYTDTVEITAICDINKTRLEYTKNRFVNVFGAPEPKMYMADEFDKMIEEQKPDGVIVSSIDRTHHRYICRAMELGCDVICEKPMTMDADKCQQIIDTIKKTGKELRVTFNYRYAPSHSQIRRLIKEDIIGDIKAVHFDWYLNTSHGADYFRRWHRDKRNSGGLLVHKATHHFDLVNFWLGTTPKQVFAYGALAFYGRENAEERGITKFYYRSKDTKNAEGDPFAIDWKSVSEDNELRYLYADAEKDDGYIRDQSVFGDGISIEDVMGVLVKYNSGAIMTYSLTAFSPVEGFRVVFTGTKGRMEYQVTEEVYVSGMGDPDREGAAVGASITVYPMFGDPYTIPVETGEGGHGGGDPRIIEDIFGNPEPDPLHRAASHIDGAMSILTGIAANKSIATGMPVDIDSLVKF